MCAVLDESVSILGSRKADDSTSFCLSLVYLFFLAFVDNLSYLVPLGIQQKDIGEAIKKPESYISQMLSINKISPEIKKEIVKTAIARQVLWDLAVFSEDEQKALWEKIKSNPTIPNLEKAKKSLQNKNKTTSTTPVATVTSFPSFCPINPSIT